MLLILVTNLESTSALVLLWAGGDIHRNFLPSEFRKFLSLESGKELHFKCNQIWPNYSEVIKNRKRCVLDLVQMEIRNDKLVQVIILGAGMDTLSLEILSQNRDVKIFEIDYSMERKKTIIEKIDFTIFNSLSLISSNLKNSKDLLKSLKKSGWNPKNSTLVVLEGISYYLSQTEMEKILKIFQSKNKKNHIILEYLLTEDLVSKRMGLIPKKIFDLIANDTGLSFITRYNQDKIKKMIKILNGSIVKRFTMKEMELKRTGNNVFFKRTKSGWIEVSYISL